MALTVLTILLVILNAPEVRGMMEEERENGDQRRNGGFGWQGHHQHQEQGFYGEDRAHVISSINQYLLFSMAKTWKENNNKSIEDVIKDISLKAGLEDVVVIKRIVACIKTKLFSLLQKWVHCEGGKQRKQFTEKLKNESYQIKICLDEMNKLKLVSQKRILTDQLAAKEEENRVLAYKLAKANASTAYWKKRFKGLVKKQIKKQRKQKLIKHSKKSFSDYSARSKYRIRNELRTECQAALDFLGLYDLIPTKVQIFDPFSQNYETLPLLNTAETELFEDNDEKQTEVAIV